MRASGVPQFDSIIRKALEEDRVRHDVTTQRLIGPSEASSARIVVKEKAVVCGLAVVRQVFQELDKKVRCVFLCPEGREAGKNATVLTVQGKTRALLAGERTALNFLGYLSGIATNARRYVRAVLPYKVAILDTRKTTPTLRELDLRKGTTKVIEFEVDTLAQFEQALAAGVDIILLDNMNCVQMKKAVTLRNKNGKWRRPLLEASGGITLKNIEQVARTGVDRISVGALTHSRRSIDVSMEFIEE
ncbi:MAG: nicotinate-nucleotide diphosphorylase (carboxylating) [Candidatus Omnitrophica bacterium]|nr:nicotinate-nucleotide diphosphorylase (carboxylating) [Candidatus Omnitrophota bacterium]